MPVLSEKQKSSISSVVVLGSMGSLGLYGLTQTETGRKVVDKTKSLLRDIIPKNVGLSQSQKDTGVKVVVGSVVGLGTIGLVSQTDLGKKTIERSKNLVKKVLP